jgi:hypothetical protein
MSRMTSFYIMWSTAPLALRLAIFNPYACDFEPYATSTREHPEDNFFSLSGVVLALTFCHLARPPVCCIPDQIDMYSVNFPKTSQNFSTVLVSRSGLCQTVPCGPCQIHDRHKHT